MVLALMERSIAVTAIAARTRLAGRAGPLNLGAGHARCAAFTTTGDVPMIKGIKFVGIPVRDQDKALEFYTKKLGFTVHTDQPFNDDQRWIELKAPGGETG